MIKFFRTIRKTLLEQNKTGRYFKYAIGEIVLVVIGILIALQINNWNENVKEIKKDQEILESLKDEINGNIITLQNSIKNNRDYGAHTITLIDSITDNYSNFSVSSLSYCFNYLPPPLNTFVLEDVLKSDRKLRSVNEEFLNSLRQLASNHSYLKKSEFFLDEYWNSKASEFFVNTGLNFSNHNFKNDSISLLDLEKGGYSKIQVVSLLDLYNDLRSAWISNQVGTLKSSEKLLLLLKK